MPSRQVQYTIRGVPAKIDKALREKAQEAGKSLNEIVIEAIKRGLGVTLDPVRHHDLDDLVGTWVPDPEFDRAIEEMDRVDPDLWR